MDCKHGIITRIDVYPANGKESVHVLRYLEKQQLKADFQIHKLALNWGDDTGAIHRGLEILRIERYITPISFSNTPQTLRLFYESRTDCFVCSKGQKLNYHRLYCNKSTGKYLRCYQTSTESCQVCDIKRSCLDKASKRKRVLAIRCYPAFFRGYQWTETPMHLSI